MTSPYPEAPPWCKAQADRTIRVAHPLVRPGLGASRGLAPFTVVDLLQVVQTPTGTEVDALPHP